MKFRPRDNNVLLRIKDSDQNQTTKLVLPYGVSTIGGTIATVVETGPGSVYEDGERSDHCVSDLKPGMKVLIPQPPDSIVFTGRKEDKLTWIGAEEIVAEVFLDQRYTWEDAEVPLPEPRLIEA